MSDPRLDSAQETLQHLLPEMKLDGLELANVSLDFYTESVDAEYTWGGKKVRLRLTMERVAELHEGRLFAAKRLREQLHKVFDVPQD